MRALVIAVALVAAQPEASPASSEDLLGAIDFTPSRDDLDAAMPSAPDELITLATGDGDVGRRLRAIRALTQYPGDPAHTALLAVLDEVEDATAGPDALVLRAAIEALGVIGTSQDVDRIAFFLDAEGATPYDGRDIRWSAAMALGAIHAGTAVAPLRARQSVEQTEQVKFAITEALRAILGS